MTRTFRRRGAEAMPGVLEGKTVVLGVTGSIACYKALDLASKLTQAGARVDTIMTYGATKFVTSLSFRSITHRPVVTDTFDPESELSVEHVALAQRADIVVVAPATAHVIARMASGLADDPLTTTILATRAPVLVAPTMDGYMYDNPATQDNLSKLRERGVSIAGPASGRLASGLVGGGQAGGDAGAPGTHQRHPGKERRPGGVLHRGQRRRDPRAHRPGPGHHQQVVGQNGLRHSRGGQGQGRPCHPGDRSHGPGGPGGGSSWCG